MLIRYYLVSFLHYNSQEKEKTAKEIEGKREINDEKVMNHWVETAAGRY